MERWGAGAHGSTYGGSPVPCAAGLATLETIAAENLTDNALAFLRLASIRLMLRRLCNPS